MKICVIAPRRGNLYCDEIYSRFSPAAEISYSLGEDWDTMLSADLIHIQWPEYLLDNRRTATSAEFEAIASKLRAGPPVIITRHNYYPHQLPKQLGLEFYLQMFMVAKAVIHLGQFSKDDYEQRYPDIASKQAHYIIPHPIYTKYRNDLDRQTARSSLGIANNAVVVLVFGIIRNRKEKQFIEESFKACTSRQKILLVPRMIAFRGAGKLPSSIRKLGLTAYGSCKRKFTNKQYYFDRIEDDNVQRFLHASDIVFIPRQGTLNSGLPFLGWSFGKVVVSPNSGNIGQAASDMGHPTFVSANSNSAGNAIDSGILLQQKLGVKEIKDVAKELFSPDKIAAETEKVLRMHMSQHPS